MIRRRLLGALLLLVLCPRPAGAVWANPTVIGTFGAGIAGGPSGSLTTTGYTFLLVSVATYTTNSVTTFTDAVTTPSCASPCNTWTPSTRYTSAGGSGIQFFFAYNPTVGTGHTFTTAGTYTYTSAIVIGSTGGQTSPSPLDLASGNTTATTSVQPWAGTPTAPAADNELIVCALTSGISADADMTISGDSFTKLQGYSYNANGFGELGTAIGYVKQTTGGAVNPTWASTTSAVGLATLLMSFKMAASATGPPTLTVLGVGR